jgi:hypothetical protein
MRVLTGFVAAAALVVSLAPAAHASQWDNLTYVTFTRPVQIPGMTLPPGTYAFKSLDQWANPHVVVILSKDQKTVYATALATTPERFNASSSKPVVLFTETRSGTAPAIRAWYLPGQRLGNEFVYQTTRGVLNADARPGAPASGVATN